MSSHDQPVRIAKLDKQLLSQPLDVRYCVRCTTSNQRPRLVLDEEGVCSACRYSEKKYNGTINWAERDQRLKKLLDEHRRVDGWWDVIVPCSGGKDSGYVAHQLKHVHGMHPLCVCWSPFERTEIGRENYRSFNEAGFTILEAIPNRHFHRKLSRMTFECCMDCWTPFALGQVSYAFWVALNFGVKLVFLGEDGELEYSGSGRKEFSHGMPVRDWAEQYWKGWDIDSLAKKGLELGYFTKDDYQESDLIFYRPPDVQEMEKAGIQFHWYGYWTRWVPTENFYYASQHTGFKTKGERTPGTYTRFASLDDVLDPVHYLGALVKYGQARAVADSSQEIRNGFITRDEGVSLVRRYDVEPPPDDTIRWACEYMQISEEQFWAVVDAWRPAHLWERAGEGWRLKHQVG